MSSGDLHESKVSCLPTALLHCMGFFPRNNKIFFLLTDLWQLYRRLSNCISRRWVFWVDFLGSRWQGHGFCNPPVQKVNILRDRVDRLYGVTT